MCCAFVINCILSINDKVGFGKAKDKFRNAITSMYILTCENEPMLASDFFKNNAIEFKIVR